MALGLASALASGELWAQPLGDCASLGLALVEHSCFHATYGPFEARLATQGRSIGAATPNLDAVHTEFRIGLAGSESSVTYRPERSGTWSVFSSEPLALLVLDEQGTSVSELGSFDATDACAALPVARVFELEAGVRYSLVLGSTARGEVVLVLEYLDDFSIDNGRDRDGDGHGDPAESVRSSCAPPEGYVQNAGDCDDTNASVHPGAQERCDEIVDRNCNGIAGDEGLSCRVGEGACQVQGVLVCDADVSRCDAMPVAPGAEVCNGVDDDCNGAIDDAEDLCIDPERPSCVREGLTAFCGCLLDQDCASEQGDRICDPVARRCMAAPVDTPAPVLELVERESGCGCRVASAPRSSLLAVASLLGGVGLVALRRRRGRSWTNFIAAALGLLLVRCSADPETDDPVGEAELDEPPLLVSSQPAAGEQGVYPAPFAEGMRLSLVFSEAMDTDVDALPFGPAGENASPLKIEWSEDAREAELLVVAPPLTGEPPLRDHTTYRLDLRALADVRGNSLAVTEGEPPALTFTTGAYDALLNHACGHTELGPFESVLGASDAPPLTATAHVSYEIRLPRMGSAFAGTTTFSTRPDVSYHLFFDREMPVSRLPLEAAPSEEPLELTPAARACEGITHRTSWASNEDAAFRLSFGPTAHETLNMIVELIAGGS